MDSKGTQAAGMGGFWSDLKSMISPKSENMFPQDESVGKHVPTVAEMKHDVPKKKVSNEHKVDFDALIHAFAKTNNKSIDYKKLKSILAALSQEND